MKKLLEVVNITREIQTESLLMFMAAIGYEAVYNNDGVLIRFFQPKLQFKGVAFRSLETAVEMHNFGPQRALDKIKSYGRTAGFNAMMKDDDLLDAFVMLFAGQARIVEKVKAAGSKNRGLVFTDDSHKVAFNTPYDEVRYTNVLGKEGDCTRLIKHPYK